MTTGISNDSSRFGEISQLGQKRILSRTGPAKTRGVSCCQVTFPWLKPFPLRPLARSHDLWISGPQIKELSECSHLGSGWIVNRNSWDRASLWFMTCLGGKKKKGGISSAISLGRTLKPTGGVPHCWPSPVHLNNSFCRFFILRVLLACSYWMAWNVVMVVVVHLMDTPRLSTLVMFWSSPGLLDSLWEHPIHRSSFPWVLWDYESLLE